MELFQIEYFFHVATRGGLSEAARHLHVSPPAISKALTNLEDALGQRLFDRQRRRLVLTSEGVHFLRRAEEILLLVEKTRAELSGPLGVKELVLAGREIFLEHFGLALCRHFQKRHPGAVVRLRGSSGIEALGAVDRGQAHLALVIQQPPKDWPKAVVSDIRFVTCVGKGHALYPRARKGQAIAIDELLEHGFVSPNSPLFGRIGSTHSIDGWRDDVHPRRIDYVVESLSLFRKLLVTGMGVGYLPDFYATELGLAALNVRGCSFRIEQRLYATAKRAADHVWLDELMDQASELGKKQ